MTIQSLRTQCWTRWVLLAALVVLPLAGCGTDEPEDDMTTTELEPTTGVAMTTEAPLAGVEEAAATAELMTADGTSVGTVRFFSAAGGGVRVEADVRGVDATGMHGFHIHENGECTPPDFTSAGGHFNPEGVEHACPPTTPRHAGDMGNVELDEGGNATFELTADNISLESGPNSVIGKAVLLHGHEDDCQSQPTGDAGPRLACGVIELSDPMATGMGMDEGMDDGTEDTAAEGTY